MKLALVALAACGHAAKPPPPPAPIVGPKTPDGVARAYLAAWGRGDAAGLQRLFLEPAEDGTLSDCAGREAVARARVRFAGHARRLAPFAGRLELTNVTLDGPLPCDFVSADRFTVHYAIDGHPHELELVVQWRIGTGGHIVRAGAVATPPKPNSPEGVAAAVIPALLAADRPALHTLYATPAQVDQLLERCPQKKLLEDELAGLEALVAQRYPNVEVDLEILEEAITPKGERVFGCKVLRDVTVVHGVAAYGKELRRAPIVLVEIAGTWRVVHAALHE